MNIVTWSLTNETSNTLEVFGYRGADFVSYFNGLQISPGQTQVIGISTDPGGVTNDTYDWIVLQDLGTKSYYQVYAEDQGGLPNTYYAFFGYYNPASSESDANPSPFLQGYANATWLPVTGQPTFTLRMTPPAQTATPQIQQAVDALVAARVATAG
jgi:hypothetical protein